MIVLLALVVPVVIGGFFLWRWYKKRQEERLAQSMLEYMSHWILPGTKITHSVGDTIVNERTVEDEEDAAKTRAAFLSGKM